MQVTECHNGSIPCLLTRKDPRKTIDTYRLIRFPNGRQVVCDPPVELPVEHDEWQDRREEEVEAGHGGKSPQKAE